LVITQKEVDWALKKIESVMVTWTPLSKSSLQGQGYIRTTWSERWSFLWKSAKPKSLLRSNWLPQRPVVGFDFKRKTSVRQKTFVIRSWIDPDMVYPMQYKISPGILNKSKFPKKYAS
jgi:hypothetical protein